MRPGKKKKKKKPRLPDAACSHRPSICHRRSRLCTATTISTQGPGTSLGSALRFSCIGEAVSGAGWLHGALAGHGWLIRCLASVTDDVSLRQGHTPGGASYRSQRTSRASRGDAFGGLGFRLLRVGGENIASPGAPTRRGPVVVTMVADRSRGPQLSLVPRGSLGHRACALGAVRCRLIRTLVPGLGRL